MLQDEAVPVEERYLILMGEASPEVRDELTDALPKTWPTHSKLYFVSFAYADLPLGKEFHRVFRRNEPWIATACLCRVVAVTQQLAHPFDYMPHGWKTITLFEFPDGIPTLLDDLPIIHTWRDGMPPRIQLASHATWAEIVEKTDRPRPT